MCNMVHGMEPVVASIPIPLACKIFVYNEHNMIITYRMQNVFTCGLPSKLYAKVVTVAVGIPSNTSLKLN